MCSSPKSKRSLVAAKKAYSGSMLSNVSAESRSRFAQNANKADERRHEQQKLKQLSQQRLRQKNPNHSEMLQTNLKKSSTFSKQKNKPVFYWLFQASFKEIIHFIFFGKNQASGKTKI